MSNVIEVYAPGTKVDIGFETVQRTGFVESIMIGPNSSIEYQVVCWKDGERTSQWYLDREVSLHHDGEATPAGKVRLIVPGQLATPTRRGPPPIAAGPSGGVGDCGGEAHYRPLFLRTLREKSFW